MSSETVQEHVDEALELVVVGNVDIDEAERIFNDATQRLDELRRVRGDA